jgi:hypothetical protein
MNFHSGIRTLLLNMILYTDGVLDRILDLLTTLTHKSELHSIIAPSLVSTLYSSLEHTLSFFQPEVSSLDVSW